MHVCTDKKILFAMPPRTGSTSFEKILVDWGLQKIDGNRHIFPSELPSIYNDYKIIGFYRNPLDRFISTLSFRKILMRPDPNTFTVNDYVNFVNNFVNSKEIKKYLFAKQIDWLATAEILDFNQYDKEILKVARLLGQTQVTVPKLNLSFNDVPRSQVLIDFVQSYYADDYRLAQERGLLV